MCVRKKGKREGGGERLSLDLREYMSQNQNQGNVQGDEKNKEKSLMI
uniref:Uncharacterized protein n=1 Tax=Medicago truncatula TaxID=3880 RepID=A2Q2C9_MEDTR|nr:hypothetical protein MtrDRAFT_AC150244g38v2 [Medicago truncatula]